MIYRVDLHVHTDGAASLDELARAARLAGLEGGPGSPPAVFARKTCPLWKKTGRNPHFAGRRGGFLQNSRFVL